MLKQTLLSRRGDDFCSCRDRRNAERDYQMVESSNRTEAALEPITSFTVLFSRIVWFFAGPVVLCFLAVRIATISDGWMSASDIAFPIVVVATVAARWICFRSGDPSNTTGGITTIEELRRYSIVFPIGGALVWAAANIIGNLIRH